jgi:hypothetical protein
MWGRRLFLFAGTMGLTACVIPVLRSTSSSSSGPVLPFIDTALLIRTDFTDDIAWRDVCAAAQAPVDTGFGNIFGATIECISDPRFDGLTVEGLLGFTPRGLEPSFVFLADAETMGRDEHPIVVVDLNREYGRIFRVIPTEMWSVENNLSIGNMDFAEFADAADSGGVFRGFR